MANPRAASWFRNPIISAQSDYCQIMNDTLISKCCVIILDAIGQLALQDIKSEEIALSSWLLSGWLNTQLLTQETGLFIALHYQKWYLALFVSTCAFVPDMMAYNYPPLLRIGNAYSVGDEIHYSFMIIIYQFVTIPFVFDFRISEDYTLSVFRRSPRCLWRIERSGRWRWQWI